MIYVPSYFLTGPPNVGKTTVLIKVIETLKARGITCGGMVTKEIREGRERVGFEIIDIQSGKKGILAHTEVHEGPKIGKYRINEIDLEQIGVKSLLEALEMADLIICDEVGPMELMSMKFKETIPKLITSNKPLLGTLHQNLPEKLLKETSDCS